MRWVVSAGASLACIASLGACGTGEDPDTPADPAGGGVQVEARQDVVVSEDPLGEVVTGELEAGDTATATCFVAYAEPETGAEGSAIRVESGDVSGYAQIADFSDDNDDPIMSFDLDESELREQLESCPT